MKLKTIILVLATTLGALAHTSEEIGVTYEIALQRADSRVDWHTVNRLI
ncbi:hypothetical protein [Candidatus Neptunochlamydia vexilliferae]|nr:hypothetical protein [Candidatus Neptunochlamydia vexilliferae]